MPQSYESHTRYHPMFHFFALPVLGINAITQIVYAVRHAESALAWWNVLVAIAIAIIAWVARAYGLQNQNRIIRLEETMRLSRVLPPDLLPRIGELSTSSLISLRFCPDEELPDLTRAILANELTSRNQIRGRIRNWRADEARI